jgi:hypothetical protein
MLSRIIKVRDSHRLVMCTMLPNYASKKKIWFRICRYVILVEHNEGISASTRVHTGQVVIINFIEIKYLPCFKFATKSITQRSPF